MATSIEPLYPDFLQNATTYAQVEQYWQQQFGQWLAPHGLSHEPFYNKETGSGQRLNDGNPIFDAYIPQRHKLVRIIQYDPAEPEGELISHYTDTWPTAEMEPGQRPQPTDPAKREAPIPELVITLFLTEDTARQTGELIRRWIVEDQSASQIETDD